jgi:hypothetical protein
VIAVLITLSVVLTASVMFPAITAAAIFAIMGGCAAVALVIGGFAVTSARRSARRAALAEAAVLIEVAELTEAVPTGTGVVAALTGAAPPVDKLSWRMPPLSELPAPVIRGARRIGLLGLRGYLALAMIMVIVKIVETALGH